jgi:hypothetical protein
MDIAGGSAITTGVAALEVLPRRINERVSFTIANWGGQIAWVLFSNDAVAVAGIGIPIYPGTVYADASGDVYKCWQGQISCIQSAGGATTLAISERVNA